MQNCLYLIGYRIFVNVASTGDFSVFPEYDPALGLCQKVL